MYYTVHIRPFVSKIAFGFAFIVKNVYRYVKHFRDWSFLWKTEMFDNAMTWHHTINKSYWSFVRMTIFFFVCIACDQNLVTSTCRTAGLSLANLWTHNGGLVWTNEQTGISWTGGTVLSVWSVNLWGIWNSEEELVWMCEPFDERLLPATAL